MTSRACVALLAVVLSAESWAQDEGEALVERAVVRNRLFPTDGRWELGVNLGLSLLPSLTEHYTGALNLSYNIVETFAVELIAGGSYTRHTRTARDAADEFATNSAKTADDLSGLWEMVAHGTLGIRWQPIYGKIGGVLQDVLFGNPLHFQLYIDLGAGGGFFKRQSVMICNAKSGADCAEYYRETKPGVVFTGGGGLRLFVPGVGKHHSLRVEIRDYSFFDSYLIGIDRTAALNPDTPTGNGTSAPNPGLTNLVQFQVGYSYMF